MNGKKETLLQKTVRLIHKEVGPLCDTSDVFTFIETPAKLNTIELTSKEKVKLKPVLRKAGLDGIIQDTLRQLRETTNMAKRKAEPSEMDPARKRSRISAENGEVYSPVGAAKSSTKSNKKKNKEISSKKTTKDSAVNTTILLTDKPKEQFSDLAGINNIIEQVKRSVVFPFRMKKYTQVLDCSDEVGVLLHGPPKSGKTTLARAVANHLSMFDVSYFEVSCGELVSGVSGESERRIRDLFSGAVESAPSFIVLDKLESVTPKSSKELQKRIGNQFAKCISELNDEDGIVRVVATTTDPNTVNPEVRGQFEEVLIPMPNRQGRSVILEKYLNSHSSKIQVSPSINLERIVDITPAYAPGDIKSLVIKAVLMAGDARMEQIMNSAGIEEDTFMNRFEIHGQIDEDELLSTMVLEQKHLEMATDKITPVGKTEGFADSPNVKWEEIGALVGVRETIEEDLLLPLIQPEWCGDDNKATGLLLYGPPGCGKTLVAKAVATGRGASFISVKGPELLNKYVGASEEAVRSVFNRARACTPCIVFFDEIDSLVVKRGKDSNGVTDRVVNQLLTEMDGLDATGDVFVIGATNRMDLLDPAILRPGRLSKKVEVPLPTAADRVDILNTLLKKRKIDTSSFDLSFIKTDAKAEGFSGADINQLIKDAWSIATKALRARLAPQFGSVFNIPQQVRIDNPVVLEQEHLLTAMSRAVRSVSTKEEKKYKRQALRAGGNTNPSNVPTPETIPTPTPDAQ
eukprot:TRINITY_DN30_c0_g2_i1.p1 TRINITY_DN30_c0_g2~~TRINITY_DN30_c0_g2_i1.p1  ORF type:complete len:745 (-),score=246.73 TRINITY_DN30_c0_g2_i1:179-2413(-)